MQIVMASKASPMKSLQETRRQGGISLYINDNWNYKVRNDLSYSSDDNEMLWLEVDKDSSKTKSNLIIGIIYRRPSSNIPDFNLKLENILTILDNEHKEIIHLADYNLNLLNSNTHLPTSEFIDINFTHSVFPVINKPTRITNTTATLIDNIFTSSSFLSDSSSGILMWEISDHFPIFLIKNKPIPDNLNTYRYTRSQSAKNKEAFNNAINQIDWLPITSNSNAQDSYSLFHKTISQMYNKAFLSNKRKLDTPQNYLGWPQA